MWVTSLDNVADSGYVMSMTTTTETEMTTKTETSQERLNRLLTEAQQRIPVGTVRSDRRGTSRWNGLAWVYGR